MKPVTVGPPLKNGARFYAHYNKSTNVSGFVVKCGSIHDPPNKRGMAHLVEHSITRATQKLSEYETELLFWRFMGGYDKDRKIETDRVATFYGHDDLLREQYMPKCLEVFADMVRNPVLETKPIRSEQGPVKEEYCLRGLDWFPILIDDLMHENTYERNPVRNRIDYNEDETLSINQKQMRKFVEKHYVPENMSLIVLGPSHAKAKELAERFLGDLGARPAPELNYDGGENFPQLSCVKSVVIPRPGIHQNHIAIGFPTETCRSKDAEILDVLAQILEFRLYMRLRIGNYDPQKGLYRIEVPTRRSFIHGLIYVYFATSNKDFVDEARDAVLDEIRRLTQEGVPDDQLNTMVLRLEDEYLDAFNRGGELADTIIDAVANGDEDLIQMHSYRKNLRKVTKKKIQDVANKYFCRNHVDISIVPE